MRIHKLLLLSLIYFAQTKCYAQEKARTGGFSYEMNVGFFTKSYTRINPDLSYYHRIKPTFLLGLVAGRTHLLSNDGAGILEGKRLFLRAENQTSLALASRYYLVNKKITPLLEARIGANVGDRTGRITPSVSLLAGYAMMFSNLRSISVGYHPQYVQYFASTYHTDAGGETVYRVDNFHPIRRIAQHFFINFLF